MTANKTSRRALTVDDIRAAYANDAWGGYGYLHERMYTAATNPALLERGDDAVLEVANAKHWSVERLFDWLDSRDGRHYGDATLGSPAADFAAQARVYVR